MTTDSLTQLIRAQGFIVLDGGLATELEARGLDLADDLWSTRPLLDAPDVVRDVHLDYFAAGADCASTATYQADPAGLIAAGIDPHDVGDVFRRAVDAATAARDLWLARPAAAARPRPLVVGSLGPYGACLADGSEYRGDYRLSRRELRDFHRPRVAALVAAGVDLIAFETVPKLEEGLAAADLLDEIEGLGGWISFSCRDATHTSFGEDLAAVASALDDRVGVAALGVNCVAPDLVAPLIARLRSGTRRALLVYPNSGERWNGAWTGADDAATIGRLATQWLDAGAAGIGGCCRTSPRTIAQIARRLR